MYNHQLLIQRKTAFFENTVLFGISFVLLFSLRVPNIFFKYDLFSCFMKGIVNFKLKSIVFLKLVG